MESQSMCQRRNQEGENRRTVCSNPSKPLKKPKFESNFGYNMPIKIVLPTAEGNFEMRIHVVSYSSKLI